MWFCWFSFYRGIIKIQLLQQYDNLLILCNLITKVQVSWTYWREEDPWSRVKLPITQKFWVCLDLTTNKLFYTNRREHRGKYLGIQNQYFGSRDLIVGIYPQKGRTWIVGYKKKKHRVTIIKNNHWTFLYVNYVRHVFVI